MSIDRLLTTQGSIKRITASRRGARFGIVAARALVYLASNAIYTLRRDKGED